MPRRNHSEDRPHLAPALAFLAVVLLAALLLAVRFEVTR